MTVEVLALLAEALALHEGEDDPIDDEEAFLRQVGVNPDEVPNGPQELPDFMRNV